VIATAPHDTDAEEAALGSALLNAAAADVVLDELTEADYWTGLHRLVHRAIAGLTRDRDGIDQVSVCAWLDANLADRDERDLWQRDGRAHVFGLTSATLVAAHVRRYVETVKRHAIARRTLHALHETATLIGSGGDPSAILADHARAIASLAETGSAAVLHHPRSVAEEWIEETRLDAATGGLRLGWPTLDAVLTTPIRRGEVVAFAARSGVGKTFALLDGCAHMLATLRRHNATGAAIFGSLEMPRTDIFERVAAQALDIRTEELRETALTATDVWPVVEGAREELDRLRIYDRSMTVDDIPRICAAARRDGLDPAIVCVDYFGLLGWHGAGRAPGIYERTSEMARALKGIARDERVVLLMAVQLNRNAGAGARPTLEMLRDSGAIEEACDRIAAFWAPERDPALSDIERAAYRNLVRACWLKNRKGLLGDTAELSYSPGRRLRELALDDAA